MTLALFALGLFAACFGLHVLLWRVHLPRRQLPTLLFLLLVAFPPLVLGACYALPALRPSLPADAPGWILVGTFHVAFSLGYAVTYTALEEDSPTLCFLLYVARRGEAGCTPAEARAFLLQGSFLSKRLESATAGGLLDERDGRLHLTPQGARLARGFLLAQRVLGLPLGG
ncbi:MAG: hypothetical protein R3F62_13600 [Planctomycetota bacterium]